MTRGTSVLSARREETNGAEDLRFRRILMGRKKSSLQEMVDIETNGVIAEMI
jgi:hypothetical protein